MITDKPAEQKYLSFSYKMVNTMNTVQRLIFTNHLLTDHETYTSNEK